MVIPALIAAAAVAASEEWGDPSPDQAPSLRVTREQALAMADDLGLEGRRRTEVAAAYSGYAAEFQRALEAWRDAQRWIDSTYPGNYGASDRSLEWELREEAHAVHAAWQEGARHLEQRLIDEIAGLAGARPDLTERLRRERARRRILAAIGEGRGAPAGAGTDVADLVARCAPDHVRDPIVVEVIDAYHDELDGRLRELDGFLWRQRFD
ncbi:MAG: hypothetical protein GY715_06455 [Planctomycetes bacterium]|nr:hypothetical protein [Planctomycetota bacterium]